MKKSKGKIRKDFWGRLGRLEGFSILPDVMSTTIMVVSNPTPAHVSASIPVMIPERIARRACLSRIWVFQE